MKADEDRKVSNNWLLNNAVRYIRRVQTNIPRNRNDIVWSLRLCKGNS